MKTPSSVLTLPLIVFIWTISPLEVFAQNSRVGWSAFSSGFEVPGLSNTIEDIDLLNTVTVQAGLAIERITLQQKLLLEHAEAQRLEELNKLKSYFVSSVSHDLKTPLTSIKMFAEILQSQKTFRGRKRRSIWRSSRGRATDSPG